MSHPSPTQWILDFGNSRVKLVSFHQDKVDQVWTDEAAWRRAGSLLESEPTLRILAAASGSIEPKWENWLHAIQSTHATLIRVKSASDVSVELDYETPNTLGLDRLANALAVAEMDAQCNWLVIDAGTCVTADLVQSSRFMGGSIAPGIDLRLRSMYAGTANLPYPEGWQGRAEVGIALHLGNDTESCLLAGAVGGLNAELNERIRAFEEETGNLRVALTGGDAKFLELRAELPIFADPNLTWVGFNHMLNRLMPHE